MLFGSVRDVLVLFLVVLIVVFRLCIYFFFFSCVLQGRVEVQSWFSRVLFFRGGQKVRVFGLFFLYFVLWVQRIVVSVVWGFVCILGVVGVGEEGGQYFGVGIGFIGQFVFEIRFVQILVLKQKMVYGLRLSCRGFLVGVKCFVF